MALMDTNSIKFAAKLVINRIMSKWTAPSTLSLCSTELILIIVTYFDFYRLSSYHLLGEIVSKELLLIFYEY